MTDRTTTPATGGTTTRNTAGAVLAALGAVLLLGQAGPAAAAAPQPNARLQPTRVGPVVGSLGTTSGYALAPVKDLRLDPFAQSAVDPLTNAVAVQPDNPGMKPLSTTGLTGSLSSGEGARKLPVAGPLLEALPGD